jgi:hypothetical protein
MHRTGGWPRRGRRGFVREHQERVSANQAHVGERRPKLPNHGVYAKSDRISSTVYGFHVDMV